MSPKQIQRIKTLEAYAEGLLNECKKLREEIEVPPRKQKSDPKFAAGVIAKRESRMKK